MKNHRGQLMVWLAAIMVTILAVVAGIGIYNTPSKRLARQLDLGNRYLEAQNYEQAIVAFDMAIKIDSMNVEAYLGLTEAYTGSGDSDKALEFAKKGYELTGDDQLKEKIDEINAELLKQYLDLGNKYLEEQNYEQAIEEFEKMLAIDPMNVEAYLGLFEVYIRMGDFDKALEYAKKGYELTGDERLKEKIEMLESGSVTASNGWVMRYSEYNYEDGAGLLYYCTYTYNLDGNRDSVSLYDAQGNLVDYGKFEYDEGGKLLVSYGMHNFKKMEPLTRMEFEYDSEDRQISTYFYSSSGELDHYYKFEYASGSLCTTQYFYDGSGNLTNWYDLEYDSEDRLIRQRCYGASGRLDAVIENEYDHEGRELVSRQYGSSGELQYYWEYEYDSEGKKIATRHYDSSGNLEREEKYE